MKFLHYILRNVRRNPVRSLLTVASTAITLFLMMSMASFASVNAEVSRSMRTYNRLVVMNAQGFAGMVPVARVREIAALPGVVAASPFCWFGGKYGEEVMPFAQFGVDPQVIFTIYDELTVPPGQLRAFQDDKAGCVIGDKLAEERGLKIGDPLPLKADLYPFDLDADDPGHLRRSRQPRPPDVHVPLGLPRRGAEAHLRQGPLGQRGRDHGQVQGRRRSWRA